MLVYKIIWKVTVKHWRVSKIWFSQMKKKTPFIQIAPPSKKHTNSFFNYHELYINTTLKSFISLNIILSLAAKRKMLLSRDVKYPPRLPGYNYFMPASGIVYLHQPCIYGIRNVKLTKFQINTITKRENIRRFKRITSKYQMQYQRNQSPFSVHLTNKFKIIRYKLYIDAYENSLIEYH